MTVVWEYTERAKHLGPGEMVVATFKEYRGKDVVILVDKSDTIWRAETVPTCGCGSTKQVECRWFNYMGTMLHPELCIDCWWEFLYDHS